MYLHKNYFNYYAITVTLILTLEVTLDGLCLSSAQYKTKTTNTCLVITLINRGKQAKIIIITFDYTYIRKIFTEK